MVIRPHVELVAVELVDILPEARLKLAFKSAFFLTSGSLNAYLFHIFQSSPAQTVARTARISPPRR